MHQKSTNGRFDGIANLSARQLTTLFGEPSNVRNWHGTTSAGKSVKSAKSHYDTRTGKTTIIAANPDELEVALNGIAAEYSQMTSVNNTGAGGTSTGRSS